MSGLQLGIGDVRVTAGFGSCQGYSWILVMSGLQLGIRNVIVLSWVYLISSWVFALVCFSLGIWTAVVMFQTGQRHFNVSELVLLLSCF